MPDAGERLSGYQYDLAGGIRIQTQPNGHRIEKQLDALGRAHTILGPDGADDLPMYRYAHAFDLYGNLARIEETYPSVRAQLEDRLLVNTYDEANRLRFETVQTGAEEVLTEYTYDTANNRTGKNVTQDDGTGAPVITLENASYTYGNALNQITAYTDLVSGKEVVYTYDLNGNRTGSAVDLTGDSVIDETTVYTYDAENRLLTHEKSKRPGSDHLPVWAGMC